MLNKILISLVLILSIGMGYSVLNLRVKNAENVSLLAQLKEQEQAILALKTTIQTQEKVCQMSDSLSAEFQQERRKLSMHASSVISKIGEVKNEQNEINVDSKLPNGLVFLLKQASGDK